MCAPVRRLIVDALRDDIPCSSPWPSWWRRFPSAYHPRLLPHRRPLILGSVVPAGMTGHNGLRPPGVRVTAAVGRGGNWKDVETSPGHDDLSRLDSLVADAQASHVRAMLVLGMSPSFYAEEPSQPPSDPSHSSDYVRVVMTRYRDYGGQCGIGAYQAWNGVRGADLLQRQRGPSTTLDSPSNTLRIDDRPVILDWRR